MHYITYTCILSKYSLQLRNYRKSSDTDETYSSDLGLANTSTLRVYYFPHYWTFYVQITLNFQVIKKKRMISLTHCWYSKQNLHRSKGRVSTENMCTQQYHWLTLNWSGCRVGLITAYFKTHCISVSIRAYK